MEITGRMLNLSNLYKLLHDTLLITENVKQILRTDCDEAAFVLKPWQVKTVVEKQVDDESICNCNKMASGNEAEEIAAGIGRAIILAQELRDKLKLNVASSKKKSWRKDSVERVYLPNLTLINDHKKMSRNNVSKNPDVKRSAQVKTDQVSCNFAAKKFTSSKFIGSAKQSDAIDKKMQDTESKTSPTKVAVKSKKEKNFILRNKLHVKKISSVNKLQAERHHFNDDSQNSEKSLTPEASAAELNDLIRKIATRQSTESAFIPDRDQINCPLHGDDARQFVQEQIAAIDVVEALQYFNVPNDIVKVLRSYHQFLKTETNDSNDKVDKYEKSRDNFLKEFEAMNTATQDCLPQEDHSLKGAAVESISIFSKISNEDLDSTQLKDMKITLDRLGISLKRYNIKNIVEPAIETPICNFSLARGWMSNGIWNISCMEHFQNFTRAYNIRYRNRKQLLSLYEAIQKLQRTKYLNTLILIILHDLMPAVKSNIESTSAEYSSIYKAMFILHQGLNPKVPVLVRTD